MFRIMRVANPSRRPPTQLSCRWTALVVATLSVAFVSPFSFADNDVHRRARLLNEYLICMEQEKRDVPTSLESAAGAERLKTACNAVEQRLMADTSESKRGEITQLLGSMRANALKARKLDDLEAAKRL